MTIKEVITKIEIELGESNIDYSGSDNGNQGSCSKVQKMIQLLNIQRLILNDLLNEPYPSTHSIAIFFLFIMQQ